MKPKDMCVCGHDVDHHEDDEGGTHECHDCECVQFYDVEDAAREAAEAGS